ncbi:hypothetical protein CFH90_14535 [Acinetobacter johnsonii]|uniref:Uncharacterized protein n=1 Tax=Acinetobacter johnsonii TaxID=40214 RepID=A0A3Q8XFH5_ACIJO|nr:hypothetical protein CFH90_14535 [Acinetobacter johnsonii]
MYTAILKKPSGSLQYQQPKPKLIQSTEFRILSLLTVCYFNSYSAYHLGSFYIPIPVVLYKTLLVINQYRLNRYKYKGCTHAS